MGMRHRRHHHAPEIVFSPEEANPADISFTPEEAHDIGR
jgi:hypothetical protein